MYVEITFFVVPIVC